MCSYYMLCLMLLNTFLFEMEAVCDYLNGIYIAFICYGSLYWTACGYSLMTSAFILQIEVAAEAQVMNAENRSCSYVIKHKLMNATVILRDTKLGAILGDHFINATIILSKWTCNHYQHHQQKLWQNKLLSLTQSITLQ